jgi:hypothetical protein
VFFGRCFSVEIMVREKKEGTRVARAPIYILPQALSLLVFLELTPHDSREVGTSYDPELSFTSALFFLGGARNVCLAGDVD